MKTSLAPSFLALVLALGCSAQATGGAAPAQSTPSEARTRDLYGRHCALCHGETGAGDGLAAVYLFPPPRDFTTGRFRLVSSANGAPADEDLAAVLTRGMPGSSMPSFDWMRPEERLALARHVRALALRGLTGRLEHEARVIGDVVAARSAGEEARRRLEPGDPLEIPAPAEPTPDGQARGGELYVESCAPCHGVDGRGEDLAPHWTADGSFAWARDFTSGVLKGGASHEALARRILAGLPGTTMPATRLEPADLSALVAHVRSLIPPGAEDRLVQHRETLHATRVSAELSCDGDEALWSQAEPVTIVLAPMEWGSEAVRQAELCALHDGQRIAIRVRWPDATRDQDQPLEEAPIDGVSLALSSDAEPPVFGMGSGEHPVNLWHWRADRMIDRAGALDLLENPPHVLRDPGFGESRTDVRPLYLPAPSLDVPTDEVVSTLGARGHERLGQAASTVLEVRAEARWDQGRWTVVFTRPLVSGMEGAVALRAGQDAQLALAIWNATPPTGLARKSITIWHRLLLDP